MRKLSFITPPPPPADPIQQVAPVNTGTTRADGLVRRTRGVSLKALELGKWYNATCTAKHKEKLNKAEGWYEWLVQVNVDGKLYFLAADEEMSDKLDVKLSVENCTFKFFLNDIKDSDVKWANPLEYIDRKFA